MSSNPVLEQSEEVLQESPRDAPNGASAKTSTFLLAALLALYVAFFFWHSSTSLLWADELFSLNTAQVRTVRDVIHVQEHWPISLDPPLYHILAHLSLALPVPPDVAMRLPAGTGFLLLLLAAYGFLKRLADSRAALLMVAILLASPLLYYATDARPYGLLLGMSACALYFWQSAICQHNNRAWSIAGLVATLAAAINCHYYGVLAAMPFFAAEAYRVYRRKKIDWPVALALLGALGSAAAWLPFLKGAAQYKSHYYIRFRLSQALSTYLDPLAFLPQTHRLMWTSAAVVFLLALLGAYRILMSALLKRSPRSPEWVAMIAFSLLPMAGLVLARLSGGGMEPRFVAETGIGIYAIIAFVCAPWLRSRAALAVCILAIAGLFLIQVQGALEKKRQSQQELTYYAALSQETGGKIDISDLGGLLQMEHYVDPAFRTRLINIYDSDAELKYENSDVLARTAIALEHFSSQPVQPYSTFATQNPTYTLVCWKAFPCWMPDYLTSKAKRVTLVHQNEMWRIYSVSDTVIR